MTQPIIRIFYDSVTKDPIRGGAILPINASGPFWVLRKGEANIDFTVAQVQGMTMQKFKALTAVVV